MTRVAFALAFILCFSASIEINTQAQTSTNKRTLPASKGRSATARAKAEQLANERRAFAIQMIASLANEARSYKNESLRATIQGRAADVLWEADQERARILFARAWEAAEAVDQAGQQQVEEARRRFLSGQGSGLIPPPPNMRAEVLRLAARRDRDLAESFLAKMQEDEKRAAEKNLTRYWNPSDPPHALAKRLELARQLLEAGDTERALLIAAPALNRVSAPAIMFLVIFRMKNPAAADQRFASLLEAAATDPLADATSISLLSSYVFTPSVLITVTTDGLLMNPWTEPLPAPDLSPSLRIGFFRTAAQVLLRPVPLPELERTSAGRNGTYFTITRLLPLFEQHYSEVVSALRSRLTALAPTIEEAIPEEQRRFVAAGFNRTQEEDESKDLSARIERASSSKERDHLLAIAARSAVMKNDLKARELAGRIEDGEFRKLVRNFVDVILVSKALESKEAEKALQLARTGELSNLQRVWAYTEIAWQLKSSTEQPQEVINQAIAEAGRIAATSAEKADAWVAIARCTAEVDRSRTWETALEAIKAINRSSDYTGEENKLSVRFQSGRTHSMVVLPATGFSLTDLFGALAKEDVYLTSEIARGIAGESPRSIALLAAGRAIFGEKPAAQ